jgi:hypothetical protein
VCMSVCLPYASLKSRTAWRIWTSFGMDAMPSAPLNHDCDMNCKICCVLSLYMSMGQKHVSCSVHCFQFWTGNIIFYEMAFKPRYTLVIAYVHADLLQEVKDFKNYYWIIRT